MNRILFKDFIIEIWKTKKRFFSIFLIVALGCGFFVGIQVTGTDMKNTLDTYFKDSNFMDLQVQSPYGLTDKDIAAIKTMEGVTAVDAAYQTDVALVYKDDSLVARVHSFHEGNQMNHFELIEGRLPERAGECLMEDSLAGSVDLPKIGDTFRINSGSDSVKLEDFLSRDTFTVVGTIRSPLYFARQKGVSTIGSGSLQTYFFVREEAFSMEVFTTAFLQGINNPETFSQIYKKAAKDLVDDLEDISAVQGPLRLKELQDKVTEAEETLQTEKIKAEAKIADAEVALSEAGSKLADGETDYQEGVVEYNTEIAKAEQELADAKEKLADARIEYAKGMTEFNEEIADAKKKLSEAEAELADGEGQYLEGRDDYLEGYREYKEGRQDFEEVAESARPLLIKGREELAASKELLDATRAQLDGAKLQLDQGKILLEEAQTEIDKNQAELDEAQTTLQQAQQIKSLLQRIINVGASFTPNQTAQAVGAVSLYDENLGDVAAAYLLDMQTSGSSPLDTVIQDAIVTLDTELTEGQAQLDEGLALLNLAIQKVAAETSVLLAMETEYLAGEDAYTAGLLLYEGGEATLAGNEKQLADGAKELRTASNQLVSADNQLLEAADVLESGTQEYEDGLTDLEAAQIEGKQKFQDALTEIEEGEQDYADGLIDFEEAKSEGQQTLNDAFVEIQDAKKEINDARIEVEDGKVELTETLAEHQIEIDDAKEIIGDIAEIKWMISSRDQIMNVREFGVNAERVDAIAAIFPVFFLAIAALVSLTTMTRMVEDQRAQVGTLKSLGYSNIPIALKFIGYAFLASFFGSLFGLVICIQLFPKLIFSAFSSTLYSMPDIIIGSHLDIVIPTVIVAILTTTLATFLVCFSMMQEQPSQLLRPQAPKPGKRILLERVTPLWKRLTFNQKVTFRNLFRYKKRMLMSVVGIAGCTALMLAGFGLRDAIGGFITTQFEDVVHYDMEVVLDDDSDNTLDFAMISATEGVTHGVVAHSEHVTVIEQLGFENSQDASMSVFPPESDLTGVISLNDVQQGDKLSLTDDGVIVTEKLAKLYSLQPGSVFLVKVDGELYELLVAGISKNYLFHFIFMTEGYYEKIFHQEAHQNRQYIRFEEEVSSDSFAVDAKAEEFLRQKNVLTVVPTRVVMDSSEELMKSLDAIVFVLIFSAGLLAFIVMYNLTNINIAERQREIASLKVLGFYDKETSSYISGENMLLAIMGAVVGLLFGTILNRFIVAVAEVDNMLFLKKIEPKSFLFAFGLTIIFTLIVRFIAYFQLKKIDMIEAMKSVE